MVFRLFFVLYFAVKIRHEILGVAYVYQNLTLTQNISNDLKFFVFLIKNNVCNLFCAGQKATESNRHIIDVKSADDKILNCCLQMIQHSRKVILITNDINLSNKAIASGIETMSTKEYQDDNS